MKSNENMKEMLKQKFPDLAIQMNEIAIPMDHIRIVFVNEVCPTNCKDDFYGNDHGAYTASVIHLFQKSGFHVANLKELLHWGIYFTNMVKRPKEESTIDNDSIRLYSSVLQLELSNFKNLSALMLMGDVAKRAYAHQNRLMKKQRVIPSGSTYKLRKGVYMDECIRVFPSYIMTGKNLEIEKSKQMMICEDIRQVMEYCEILHSRDNRIENPSIQ